MASRPSTPNWRCVSLADLLLELKRRLPEIKNEEQDPLLLALLCDAASMIFFGILAYRITVCIKLNGFSRC